MSVSETSTKILGGSFLGVLRLPLRELCFFRQPFPSSFASRKNCSKNYSVFSDREMCVQAQAAIQEEIKKEEMKKALRAAAAANGAANGSASSSASNGNGVPSETAKLLAQVGDDDDDDDEDESYQPPEDSDERDEDLVEMMQDA